MDKIKIMDKLIAMANNALPDEVVHDGQSEVWLEDFITSAVREKVKYMSQEQPTQCVHGPFTPSEGCIGCDICREEDDE